MQFLIVCSPGPILACFVWLGSRRETEKISLGSAAYSSVYGAVGCTLSVLLIENYVRVLFEVTRSGYLQVGVYGRNILLFAPPLFLFPFLEEAMKTLGVARLVSSGRSRSRRQSALLGLLSGAGFSSSMNLVRATILFTRRELTRRFLPEFLRSISSAMVHSGATGLLSYFLSQAILGERPGSPLLKVYMVTVLVQVLYQLILTVGSVLGVPAEFYSLLFAILFFSGLVLYSRR